MPAYLPQPIRKPEASACIPAGHRTQEPANARGRPRSPQAPPLARPSAARLDVPRTGRNITACRAGRLGSHGQRTGAEQHGHGDESAEHCGGSERKGCRGRLLADPAARAGRPARAKLTTTHRATSTSSHRKHHVEPPLQRKAGVEPQGPGRGGKADRGGKASTAPRCPGEAGQHGSTRPLALAKLMIAASLLQAGLATGPCAWQLRQNRLVGGASDATM